MKKIHKEERKQVTYIDTKTVTVKQSSSHLASLNTVSIVLISSFLEQHDYLQLVYSCHSLCNDLTLSLIVAKPSSGFNDRLQSVIELSLIVSDDPLYHASVAVDKCQTRLKSLSPFWHRLQKLYIHFLDYRMNADAIGTPRFKSLYLPMLSANLQEFGIFHHHRVINSPYLPLAEIDASHLISNLTPCANSLLKCYIWIPCVYQGGILHDFQSFPKITQLVIRWEGETPEFGNICPLFLMAPKLQKLDFASKNKFNPYGLGDLQNGLQEKHSFLTHLDLSRSEQTSQVDLRSCSQLKSFRARESSLMSMLEDLDDNDANARWLLPPSIQEFSMEHITFNYTHGPWSYLSNLRRLELFFEEDIEDQEDLPVYVIPMNVVADACPLLETFILQFPKHMSTPTLEQYHGWYGRFRRHKHCQKQEMDNIQSWITGPLGLVKSDTDEKTTFALPHLRLLVLCDEQNQTLEEIFADEKCPCQSTISNTECVNLRRQRPTLQVFIRICQIFWASHCSLDSRVRKSIRSLKWTSDFTQCDFDYESHDFCFRNTRSQHLIDNRKYLEHELKAEHRRLEQQNAFQPSKPEFTSLSSDD